MVQVTEKNQENVYLQNKVKSQQEKAEKQCGLEPQV